MKHSFSDLVQMAREKDPHFNEQMAYWIDKRKKIPSLKWMMNRLSDVLGVPFLRENARGTIALNDTESDSES